VFRKKEKIMENQVCGKGMAGRLKEGLKKGMSIERPEDGLKKGRMDFIFFSFFYFFSKGDRHTPVRS
jgi:hypothetical protein